MRPLPMVAGGASGGLAGFLLTVAKDVLSGSSSQVLIPPETEPFTLTGLDLKPFPSDNLQIHWPSLVF